MAGGGGGSCGDILDTEHVLDHVEPMEWQSNIM